MESRKGFTIVELLIVIVVIGILAAIVIVSYQGVTVRARNVQLVTAAQSYVEALTRYGIVEGSYPTIETGMSPGVCLGTGYTDNHCWIGGSNYDVNATFDTLLKDYVSIKPAIPPKMYQVNTNIQRSGLVYVRATTSVQYYLDGKNQDCVINGVSGANQGINGSAATFCQVNLPAL